MLIFTFRLILASFLTLTIVPHHEPPAPAYMEWGELAATAIKDEYPDFELKDYTFAGKTIISEEREQYTFKVWIEKNNEAQVVHTYVLIDPQTEQPIHVFFDELSNETALSL